METISVESTNSSEMEVNLADFMDVVTTYRCRFCNFTCTQPQGISSHVRSVHIKVTTESQTGILPGTTLQNLSISTSEQVQITTSSSVAAQEQLNVAPKNITCSNSVSQDPPPSLTSPTATLALKVSGPLLNSASHDCPVVLAQAPVTQAQSQIVSTQNNIFTTASNIVSSYIPLLSSGGDAGALTFVSHPAVDSQAIDQYSMTTESVHQENQVSSVAVNTKELFLCGQCNIGFNNMDECKLHMVQVHNILLPSQDSANTEGITRVSVGTQVVQTRKKPGRKRKSLCPVRSLSPESDKDWELDDSNDGYGRKGRSRRKIRPPRALKEDYYLGKKKKRSRESYLLTENYNVRCDVHGCFAKFKNQKSLETHKACHRDGDNLTFVCCQCSAVFVQWRHLRMHLWRKHEMDTDLFSCENEGCDFRTDTVHKLLIHREIHGEERPYTCDVCGKGFKQFSQMRNHQMIHAEHQSNDPNKWYTSKQCDVCKRSFANQKCLKKHVQAVHTKFKPFICPYCGHSTARKAMLQLHIRVHTGEKPFKCDVCQYATGDHNSLRRHKMRHTGLKPYKCQYCSYSCIQAISLKTHMKNKHPGCSGIYCCNLCNYRTVNRVSLDNHVEDHKNGLIDAQGVMTDVHGTVAHPKTRSQKTGEAMEIQMQVQTMANGEAHISTEDLAKVSNTCEGLVPSDINAAQLICSALNAISQNPNQTSHILGGVQTTINSSSKQGVSTHTITFHLPATQSASQAVTTNQAVGQTFLMVQPIEICSMNEENIAGETPADNNIQMSFDDTSDELRVINTEEVLEAGKTNDEVTEGGLIS